MYGKKIKWYRLQTKWDYREKYYVTFRYCSTDARVFNNGSTRKVWQRRAVPWPVPRQPTFPGSERSPGPVFHTPARRDVSLGTSPPPGPPRVASRWRAPQPQDTDCTAQHRTKGPASWIIRQLSGVSLLNNDKWLQCCEYSSRDLPFHVNDSIRIDLKQLSTAECL
jgi:hypothetical protein